MKDFDLRKYLAENNLLKEDSSQGDMYGFGPAYQALDSGIQYYIDEFIKDINADIEAGTDKASITEYLNDLIKAIAALRDSVTFPPDLAENRLLKEEVKVGDTIGNTVQGFDFEVIGIEGDKYHVKHKRSGKEFKTDKDNMYKGNPGLQENINMATILSHDDYHDLYIGNKAEHDARDEEEQFSGEYMIDLDPGMYQMIFWNDEGPSHMSFNNKLDYVKGAIRNFWGEDHFIEKFGIEDEVGGNWDYFDQHTEDNLDMYYEELNNLINNSYPDGDSASGVVLLVNGKRVAGEAAEI